MSKRSSRQFIVGAVVLSASLLLGACGSDGGDGKSSDDIEGAGKKAGSKSDASPSASESAGAEAPGAPEFDFPKDFRVKIDADTTGDKTKDTVLRDHGYALQAIEMGFVHEKPDLSIMKKYVIGDADVQWRSSITDYREGGVTSTGTVHYYNRKVTLLSGGKSATVQYCESDRHAFDKDIKTDKVKRTKPGPDDFVSIQDRMKRGSGGTWQIVRTAGKEGAKQCAE
ncbi:hypothetical protein [Streptomyces sp. NPDC048172]|uniref:hypothetical protein n=1 Tax=Streptomyces sp. NPDC048172 TaxID=3365505 RepID=UPI003718703B